MSIQVPHIFVPETPAVAEEVNENFAQVYNQTNAHTAQFSQVNSQLVSLQNTKANINGDSTQRFAVANPQASMDAVNKSYLNTAMGAAVWFINGLILSKESNNSILVTAGTAYDSTGVQVLNLPNPSTKTNSPQAVNSTYYVYVIGQAQGIAVDVLISTSSIEPTLPSNYVYYRQIGNFSTNADGNIDVVNSWLAQQIQQSAPPIQVADYSKPTSIARNTLYTVTKLGVMYASTQDDGTNSYLDLNGITLEWNGNNTYGSVNGSFFDVSPGDTVRIRGGTGGTYRNYMRFYPMKTIAAQ